MSRLPPEHFIAFADAEAAKRADTYDYVAATLTIGTFTP